LKNSTTPPVDNSALNLLYAAERTLLAWIRTGLAMMGFGFVVARFGLFLNELARHDLIKVTSTGVSLWLGLLMVLLGVAVNALAAAEHVRFLRRFGFAETNFKAVWRLGVIVSIVLSLIGTGMAVYLFVVEYA